MIEQLTPAEVDRDECGQWSHPKLIQYLDDLVGDDEYVTTEQWEKFKKDFNIETVSFWLSACVSCDEFEQIMDGCDLSKWNLNEPNGFFLIDIGFTEEDAQAIFAREIRQDSEVPA